jgi:hypothetical protein
LYPAWSVPGGGDVVQPHVVDESKVERGVNMIDKTRGKNIYKTNPVMCSLGIMSRDDVAEALRSSISV